jgi:hypothetical protein
MCSQSQIGFNSSAHVSMEMQDGNRPAQLGQTGIPSNRLLMSDVFPEMASRGGYRRGQEAPSKECGAGGLEPIIERDRLMVSEQYGSG